MALQLLKMWPPKSSVQLVHFTTDTFEAVTYCTILTVFSPATYLQGAELVLTTDSRSATPKIPLSFVEPEGSVPCSQEPVTGFFSEPDEFGSHAHTQILLYPF
jgi:hypothetical protein